MKAAEWIEGRTTNAPYAQAEADVNELGRRVAEEYDHQQGDWWDAVQLA